MHTTVLYHAACPDGYAAMYACWQHFGTEAQYLPVRHGEPPPAIPPEHTVFLVDFCYPEATMRDLLAQRSGPRTREQPCLVVLDHHASAERALTALQAQDLPGVFLWFDLDECGASLAWQYFHGGVAPEYAEAPTLPTFFRYVRDRDLWRFALPESKPISLAYWSLSKTPQAIAGFAAALDTPDGYARIVIDGRAMERYADALVREQAARARLMTLAGQVVPVVNATTLFSEVGDYLCRQHPDAPFAAYYFFRDTETVQWGLRSRNDCDVSVVAGQFSGGGHKQAAGFVTTKEQFDTIIKQL